MVLIAMWKYRYFKPVNTLVSHAAALHRFVSIRDKEIRRRMRPDYQYGCKRPTLSNSYYRSFNRPNVHLECAGIERIEADGIVTRDGASGSSTPWCWPRASMCGTPTCPRSR